ncbi:protease complex subunit PrcB family protein [Clostridium sp. JS66]|nr:protease complex subunit PrcB family protein [Clostridium sp. JS66]WPC40645.1 protease complex subunit PrcB family protein [Clostridium sp. JS66]
MRKKFLISTCIALGIGLVYMPFKVSAAVLSKNTNSIEAKTYSIIYNKVNFHTISQDEAPSDLMKKIELYKNNEGFVSYTDSSSNKSYIAVMSGEKPTSGYGITVKAVEDSEQQVNVLVEETSPDNNVALSQIASYPYTIIEADVPLHNITVKNSDGKNFSYYDIQRSFQPIIGISWASGNLKNIYKENNFIFLEIQNSNGVSQFFYLNDNEESENKIKDLKLNSNVTIKYALGTPQKYNNNSSFPLTEILLPVDKSSFTDSKWQDLNFQKNLDKNMQLTLYYDKELAKENVNNTNIYVVDSDGTRIPTEASLSDDKKSIRIIPLKPYVANQTYYLFITSDVTSNIKVSNQGYRMQFQVSIQ